MIPPSPSSPTLPESPYRVAAAVADRAHPRGEEPVDDALAWMAVAFVLVSLLRAAHPLFGNEVFGTEPTLALLAALVVGHQLARDLRLRVTRRRGRETSPKAGLGGALRC